MRMYAYAAMVVGYGLIRGHALAGETAIGQLMQQSGAEALPEVLAPSASPRPSANGSEPKTELVRFAKCTGAFDGVPFTLDFLAQHPAGKPSNNGVMNMIGPDGFKIEHKIVIVADDERGSRIELFAALDPAIKFAEFSIPKADKSRVTIHAIHFRADWATVDCRR